MELLKKPISALVNTALALALSVGMTAAVQAETTFTSPGNVNTGSYHDYMKTVYARAGNPELSQLPLTAFDHEFELAPIAAESWSMSDDRLTWTFKLREGLVWSDGEPLKASDYVFALTRAATNGYDFAWYWDFAGGIKNWAEVTKGEKDVSELGLRAVDDLTIEVTTKAPKPYLPSVVSLWYPVPEHVWKVHGDDWAVNLDTLVTSGPWVVESWEKSNNTMVLAKSPSYTGPWPSQLDKITTDPAVGDPAVGLPAFMAGDVDMTELNTGQIPFVQQRMGDQLRETVVFAITYLSFNLNEAPFDNADARRALWYAIDRKEMTETVLNGLVIPGKSLLTPGFPGYNQDIADQAVFDLEKAREFLAKAGYPGGEGFPKITLETRIGGGYEAAISPPMAQYLQAEFKENLGIDIEISVEPVSNWMDSLRGGKGKLYLSPYEFDYLDPSNFYGIFYNGGRHNYFNEEYDKYVAEADSSSKWEERLALYAKAEQVMIDEALIVPLIHPKKVAVISDKLKGKGVEQASSGYSPLTEVDLYFYTHTYK